MALEHLLHQLAVLIGIAILVVGLLGRLGLPPIAGFLVAGILVGPGGLGLVADPHDVEVAAELGVALLLFTIGLEFSLARLRQMAAQVFVGGGLQVGLTTLAAAGGALALGHSVREGVFFGFMAALSSTAIVLRALADRGESASPHGRLSVAILIFQDLAIVPMLLVLPMLAGAGGGVLGLVATLTKAAVVVAGVLLLARGVVPWLLRRAAATRRRELFLLTVLLVAALVASGTASIGLSVALGAFLAGVVIADTDFVHQASSDVAPFRDALASLFFVSMGMLLDPKVLLTDGPTVGALFLALVVGKTLIVVIVGVAARTPVRVAITTGVALAQVGEFSFVLLQSGQEAGLVSGSTARSFIAASVLTMIVTPFLIALAPRIGDVGARWLAPVDRWSRARAENQTPPEVPQGHVIVAGLGVGGQLLLAALEGAGVPYVALDLDPGAVSRERARGRNARYGDVARPEVLDHVAHAGSARLLVLLLSDPVSVRQTVAQVHERYPDLPMLLRAHRAERPEIPSTCRNVDVVSEDHEAALEIVERTLHQVGAEAAVLASAMSATRTARGSHGERLLSAPAVLAGMAMDAVTLNEGDWAVGRALADLGLRDIDGALVVAVSHQGKVSAAPRADRVVGAGDVVFLFGGRDQLAGSAMHLRAGPREQPASA